MKARFYKVVIILLCLGTSILSQAQTEILSNARIIKLSKAGMDESVILSKIEASTSKFDLSDDGLIALKSGGVSGNVIKAMMDKAAGKKVIPPQPDKPAAAALPIPAYLNEINFYDESNKASKPLEKAKAKVITKPKVMGLGGAEMVIELTGEKSSFRVQAKDSISFLVNLESAMGDPNGWFTLYKADIKKGNRIAVWVKTGGFNGNSAGKNILAYNVRKLKDNTFQIVPAEKLAKGEYLFFAKGTMMNYGGQGGDAFVFGVD